MGAGLGPFNKRDGRAETCRDLVNAWDSALANASPLATAMLAVVKAAEKYREHVFGHGHGKAYRAELGLRDAVDALRALREAK